MPEQTVYGPSRAVAHWLEANSIDPQDVPVDSPLTIEVDSFHGHRYIRYNALLRNELGHLHFDSTTGRAAVELQTAHLVIEPPEDVRIPTADHIPGAD
ncbi:hypothetical protein ACFW9I_37075 [[Kitasatospora] papulosa]|uniref:hypothetical protein n=1 Tax=[Kitasatospora] papulosa TaxID=1464011 RepID=UPI0036BAE411